MNSSRSKYLCSGLLLVSLLGVGRPLLADTPANVPADFQDLYPVLQRDLDTFQQQSLDPNLPASPPSVLFSADLSYADANAGISFLLTPTTLSHDIPDEIKGLQQMGINSVVIAIPLPIMYQPYYVYEHTIHPGNSVANIDASTTTAFYQSVVSKAKIAGLKVAIECHVMFTNQVGSAGLPDLAEYFQSLTLNQYEAARSSMCVTVAQILKPDYLSVLAEPDAEAGQSTLFDFNYSSNDIDLVTMIVSSLTAAGIDHAVTKVAAGADAWTYQSFLSYANAMAALLGLDDLDIHTYPITNPTNYGNELQNALTEINLAQAHGKGVIMTESWLQKMRDNEVMTSAGILYGRDPFSFWEPLDEEFTQVITKLAYVGNMKLISFYWTRQFFSYLDYNNVPGCPAPADQTCSGQTGSTTIQQDENIASGDNLLGTTIALNPTSLAVHQYTLGHYLPEITNYASASPASVSGTTTTLSVSANDGDNGSNVTYLWQSTGTPPSTPVIASPTAASTPVTFSSSGTYNFTVTVTANTGGLSVQTSTQVIVGAASPTGPIIPVLNFPAFVPLNGQLSFIDSVDTSFLWTFTLQLNPSSPLTTTTSVPSLNVGTLPLSPSAYVVQVTAINAQETASAPSHAIVTFAPSGLNQIRVYPNPWRSDQDSSLPITFDHLTLGSTVKIFDIAGHWVKTLTPANDSVTWDRTNDNGNSVASGLYFYLITDGQGNKVRGKLTIIK